MARLRVEDLDPETRARLQASGQLPPDPEPEREPVTGAPTPGPGRRARPRPQAEPGPLDRVPHTKPTSTGAGFILGLIAWAVVRAYLTGGTAGVRQWMAAKFVNKTGTE
jgi:hypothetical protein